MYKSTVVTGYRGSQGSHMYNLCLQRVLHARYNYCCFLAWERPPGS